MVPDFVMFVVGLLPLGLAVYAVVTLVRIRDAAEETNRRLAKIESKFSK